MDVKIWVNSTFNRSQLHPIYMLNEAASQVDALSSSEVSIVNELNVVIQEEQK